ncbi:MAG: tyrosine-protein phosphatase [Erysipelotrichaceae bacterium]|nr:tyrosine-protein phosphatase [Erysipelotrichaceae bacterium]
MLAVLPFEKIVNCRDIGKIPARDGRVVKSGLLYRSAGLSEATGNDLEMLKSLGLRHILDLRGSKEQASEPEPMLEGVQYHPIPGMVENEYTMSKTLNFMELVRNDMSREEMFEANAFLREAYGFMGFDNAAFSFLFSLLKEEEVPLLYHCSGGKDRTGLATILILTLLGVKEERVIEDYLFSNNFIGADGYIESQIALRHITDKEVQKCMYEVCSVSMDFYNIFKNSVMEKYGSWETYFLKEYGIDEVCRKKLCDRYLE